MCKHAHRERHSSQINAFMRRKFLQPEGLKLLFKGCNNPPTTGFDPELPSPLLFLEELIPNAGLLSSGTRSGPPAGPRKPSPTPREPAPAPQRRPAGLASPRPTGARDADATQIGTSPSTRPSTPPGERRATSWTEKSGRGGITHEIVFV